MPPMWTPIEVGEQSIFFRLRESDIKVRSSASEARANNDSLSGNLAVCVLINNCGNLCSEVFPTATATRTTTTATVGEDGDMADQFCSTAQLDKNGDDVIDKETFLKAATREWSFMEDEQIQTKLRHCRINTALVL